MVIFLIVHQFNSSETLKRISRIYTQDIQARDGFPVIPKCVTLNDPEFCLLSTYNKPMIDSWGCTAWQPVGRVHTFQQERCYISLNENMKRVTF